MGRRRLQISEKDKKQIEALAGFGLTLDQIALVLNISPRTLDNWLQNDEINALYKKGCAVAEATIARTLFEKAKAGDMTALIWWEKTRAGRMDKAAEINKHSYVNPVTIYIPENGRDLSALQNGQK